jgi:hypothetical protein
MMHRRPSTQDITWLLDLHTNKQLDLNPPYQRRSVWTRKDKQFFLDTIFRNYPSPAIFLHKTINDAGKATYHVVDGKQRTQTILEFVNNKLRMPSTYGDNRLDGKKWSNLEGEQALKQRFWNYQITVEMIDIVEGTIVNEVFERLNRNSRKLTAQELRHAKYEGWFITVVEAEAEKDDWRDLGVATTARAKRMVDAQFISELMLVVLENGLMGFDQDALNELYAKYDDPDEESIPDWNPEQELKRFDEVKRYLVQMNAEKATVEAYAKGFGHFYTLWAFVALSPKLPAPKKLAASYAAFMQRVQTLAGQDDLEAFLLKAKKGEYTLALSYLNNSRGASTDLGPRQERLKALTSALTGK